MISKDPLRRLKTGSFSAETLKMVYLRLLKNLPFYRHIKQRELLNTGLRIPGELDDVSLTFQVQLLFCEANTGAFNLAKEIQDLHPDRISLEVLHDLNGFIGDTEEEGGDSIFNGFPIKKRDDIEEGLSLCVGNFSQGVNEVEALIIDDEANDDDLSEEKSNASLSDSSSIDAADNVAHVGNVKIKPESLKDGLSFKQISENENDSITNRQDDLDEDLSLASKKDIGESTEETGISTTIPSASST